MSNTNKLQYNQFVLTSNKSIKEHENHICKLESQFTNKTNSDQYIVLAIVTYQLRIINIYFQQNKLYHSLFNTNNKSLLENNRKVFVDIVILLKKHFTVRILDNFSKPEDYVHQLKLLSTQRLFNLISQLDFLCSQLKYMYGNTSKYILPIASIYGDICCFTLNIIDFPKYFNIVRDLSHEDYRYTKEILELVEKMMERASVFFMDAYQISDNDKQQVRKAIQFLNLLETFYRVSGHKVDLENLNRKKHSWERFLS